MLTLPSDQRRRSRPCPRSTPPLFDLCQPPPAGRRALPAASSSDPALRGNTAGSVGSHVLASAGSNTAGSEGQVASGDTDAEIRGSRGVASWAGAGWCLLAVVGSLPAASSSEPWPHRHSSSCLASGTHTTIYFGHQILGRKLMRWLLTLPRANRKV